MVTILTTVLNEGSGGYIAITMSTINESNVMTAVNPKTATYSLMRQEDGTVFHNAESLTVGNFSNGVYNLAILGADTVNETGADQETFILTLEKTNDTVNFGNDQPTNQEFGFKVQRLIGLHLLKLKTRPALSRF